MIFYIGQRLLFVPTDNTPREQVEVIEVRWPDGDALLSNGYRASRCGAVRGIGADIARVYDIGHVVPA